MLTLLLCSALPMLPAATQAAPVEVTTYQLVLLKKGTTPPPSAPDAQRKMQDEHLSRLADLNRKRINLLYGPVMADGDLAGVAVLDVKTAGEATQAFADDPFVKAGVMVAEVHPWRGPKNAFRLPPSYDVTNPSSLDPLVLGFLKGGPSPSADASGRDTIHQQHLAYLESLRAQGTLLVSGPLTDDGVARTLVIYRVANVDAAKTVAAGDPAVKVGRLVLEAWPWMTFKGILR